MLQLWLIRYESKNWVWRSYPFPSHPPGEVTRDNPYDDVKISPMCLPITRSHTRKVKKEIPFLFPLHCLELSFILYCCCVITCNKRNVNFSLCVFQLSHKPQMLHGYSSKVERKRFQSLMASKPLISADPPKLTTPRRTSTQKIQMTPQVNNKWIMS